MKCLVLHESQGRLRVHLCINRMTLHSADVLEYYLRGVAGVTDVKVYDRTCDAAVTYNGARADVIKAFAAFSPAKAETEVTIPEHTARALNREFEDKLVSAVLRRFFFKAVFAAAAALGNSSLSLAALYKGRLKGAYKGQAFRIGA